MSDQSPEHRPYVSPSTSLPEITIKSLFLGIVLAIVLGAANALPWTLWQASPSRRRFLLQSFRWLFYGLSRASNILENNIVQTAASAGESVSAGVIFTIPALVILGTWTEFNYWETTMIAGFGGFLGVLFTIPLRRALIIENSLAFPRGRCDCGNSESR